MKDMLRHMTKETQKDAQQQTRGTLEKIDVRLPSETKSRLEAIAKREQRSGNKQAVYYIESGVNGIDLEALARKIDRIEAMLTEALRRLDEK
ncbi:hypothetical protein [Eoetvoesiella caeni]|nr:hypothetical protein [Eoetvoesiella caeni]MCI2809355.1 hypothetical protein [Eoetvoesiella caeni]NYT54496.1 hypothetical protein [Eoetvoesiella caeni]